MLQSSPLWAWCSSTESKTLCQEAAPRLWFCALVGEPSSPPGPASLQAARACLGKEGTFQPNQAAAHKGTRLGGDASHRHPCAPAGPRDPWDAVGLLRPGHKRGPAGTKAREAFQSKAPWVLVFHPRVESAWPGSGFQTLAFWPLCGRPQDGWPQRARCCWGPPGERRHVQAQALSLTRENVVSGLRLKQQKPLHPSRTGGALGRRGAGSP